MTANKIVIIMTSKMNSLYQSNIAKVIRIAFLSTVIMLMSCKNNKASSQGKTKTEAKTPNIDIHKAVVVENDIETVKQHIAAKSNTNEKDPFGGSSPLISASLFRKTEIVKLLIDAGANLNIQNNSESLDTLWTPLTMLNIWRIPLLFFVSKNGHLFFEAKIHPNDQISLALNAISIFKIFDEFYIK